jgi:hypothetical protein
LSAMTLDEYRRQVFERLKKLKAGAEVSQVRGLLAEVQAMLASSHMSDGGQKGFWQSLSHDLNVLVDELSRPPDNPLSSARRALIAAAQVAIAQYQRQHKSNG